VDDMCERNSDILQEDFLSMVSGHGEMDGSINKFFKTLVVEHEEGEGDALKRAPSFKKLKKKDLKNDGKKLVQRDDSTVSSIYRKALSEIMAALTETRTWVILHVKAASQESSFDPEFIRAQISIVDFKMLKENPAQAYSSWMSMVEFDKRYGDSLNANLRVCSPDCVLVPGMK
jgi:myosin heavy subunit